VVFRAFEALAEYAVFLAEDDLCVVVFFVVVAVEVVVVGDVADDGVACAKALAGADTGRHNAAPSSIEPTLTSNTGRIRRTNPPSTLGTFWWDNRSVTVTSSAFNT
jgi:hypothetical protein